MLALGTIRERLLLERWKQRLGLTYVHPVFEETVAMLSFVMTASCGFTRNEVVLHSFKYVLWVV